MQCRSAASKCRREIDLQAKELWWWDIGVYRNVPLGGGVLNEIALSLLPPLSVDAVPSRARSCSFFSRLYSMRSLNSRSSISSRALLWARTNADKQAHEQRGCKYHVPQILRRWYKLWYLHNTTLMVFRKWFCTCIGYVLSSIHHDHRHIVMLMYIRWTTCLLWIWIKTFSNLTVLNDRSDSP